MRYPKVWQRIAPLVPKSAYKGLPATWHALLFPFQFPT